MGNASNPSMNAMGSFANLARQPKSTYPGLPASYLNQAGPQNLGGMMSRYPPGGSEGPGGMTGNMQNPDFLAGLRDAARNMQQQPDVSGGNRPGLRMMQNQGGVMGPRNQGGNPRQPRWMGNQQPQNAAISREDYYAQNPTLPNPANQLTGMGGIPGINPNRRPAGY